MVVSREIRLVRSHSSITEGGIIETERSQSKDSDSPELILYIDEDDVSLD